MVLTHAAEKRVFSQHVGTGWLILKTAPNEVLQVEVFLRPRDGVLCRITDGQPALPLTLSPDDDEE
jgi:hypothetical protein